MSTKDKLLIILSENPEAFVSGEAISRELGVSRNAIWKAVTSLRESGYVIDAVQNRGYRLVRHADILSADEIRRLTSDTDGIFTDVFSSTGSTNDVCKAAAAEGKAEGYIAIASEQTHGKGRSGRSFYSPPGTGIYLSILLRPRNLTPEQAQSITTIAAVAGCEAIEEASDKSAEIKWVNDIFVSGRKVAGILTEAALSIEGGYLDYAVLGIGFNAYEPRGGFPAEIADTAGAIWTSDEAGARNRLAAAFINSFMKYYRNADSASFSGKASYVDAYRKRCFVIGKEVTVISASGSEPAEVTGVDDNCRLLVRYPDGRRAALSSGEIRIRPLEK